ncbi:Cation-independent mannose-6-phosphate receptor CI-MPR, partial [Coemansia sp. RSA 2618]
MHSELGRSLWLLLLLLLTQTIAVHGTDCVIENDSGTVRYDLRALERQGGYDVDGYDTDYTFKLNVCASLSDPHEPSAAGAGRWFRGEHSGTLGSLGAKPQLRGEKLVLEYAGGDTCPGAPQLNQSALISFICDSRTDGRPEFVAEWAGCAFMFEWRTRAACGSTVLASNDQHVEADEG